jgi:hypothetical protein
MYGDKLSKAGACKDIHIKRTLLVRIVLNIKHNSIVTDNKGLHWICYCYPVSKIRRKRGKYCPFPFANFALEAAYTSLFGRLKEINMFNAMLKDIYSSSSIRDKIIGHNLMFLFMKNKLNFDVLDWRRYPHVDFKALTDVVELFFIHGRTIKKKAPHIYKRYEHWLIIATKVVCPFKAIQIYLKIVNILYESKVVDPIAILKIENTICKRYKIDLRGLKRSMKVVENRGL